MNDTQLMDLFDNKETTKLQLLMQARLALAIIIRR